MASALVSSAGPRRTCDMVQALERARWTVTWVESGPGLDEAIARRQPDVIVWSLGSEVSASQSLREMADELRAVEIPIFVVCELEGAGAVRRTPWVEDFLVRPIRGRELDARLEQLVGHSASALDVLTVGPLTLDTKGFAASLHGEPMSLTYQEFRLLRFLMQHPNEVFTRDQLLARVWSYDYFGGPRTVDIHIRRLRAKLVGALDGCIETVRCVGYRWAPERVDEP